MRVPHPALRLALALSLPLALALVTPACAREGPAVLAPLDVTIENADGGSSVPLVVNAPPAQHPRSGCSARLRASPIKVKEGCTLDERISQGSGTLLYPCSGDGPVEAVFGEHRFQGTLTATVLSLALTTEIDWEDNCHWETKQAIKGELKREAGKQARLQWTYSEAPVAGTGCFGSCRATADIEADELSH
jgi:hypothetical protein